MSKKLFTEEEIIILKQNKYIKKVSSKGITYTDEFKKIFIILFSKKALTYYDNFVIIILYFVERCRHEEEQT